MAAPHVHVDVDTLADAGSSQDHSHGHSHGRGHSHGHGHSHGECGHSHGSQFQFQPRAQDGVHGPPPAPVPAKELTPLEELFYCAKTANLERFRALVEQTPDSAQQRDPMGHTLAHWMAQRGSAELLEFAHSVNVPMNLPSEDSVKLHPIHWACSTGNLVALKTFVKLGVDVNTADALKQRTPLLIAAQNGFPLLVMYLIKNGADITLVDADEDSAIHWAAYKGATEIVSVFQYLGLSSDGPDRYGQTPLHLAAMRGELPTVQYLVEELDSDLNAQDAQGRTPLELARLKGYKRVVNYLSRQMFRNRWNVFSWWEASRGPYFYTLANILLSNLLYVFVLIPAMPDMRYVWVPHMMWNVTTWVFFYFTVRTSPGDVTEDSVYAQEYAAVTEAMISADNDDGGQLRLERPLCHSCHVQRPLRAKHCRVCKTCIDQFDHHCPFVDNCVGRNNHVYFLAFVGFLMFNIMGLEYVLYLYWHYIGFSYWVLACMVYFGVMFLPVAQLFGFHVYLTAKNLTTNEVMNSHRYQHMRTAQGAFQNPFDKGVLWNCAERCLPSYIWSDSDDNDHVATMRKRVTTNQGEYLQVPGTNSDSTSPV